jgi:hypothetical protein
MDIEYKAELMSRLRAEGRWQDATDFRESRRLKAKRDGLSRAEAKEQAWQEMADAFPPMAQQQIDLLPSIRWLVMGQFPMSSFPKNADPEQVSYASIWGGACASIALLHAKMKSCEAWFAIVEQLVARVNKDPTNEELRCVSMHALATPYGFLAEYVVPSFARLLHPHDQLTPEDHAELAALVKAIEAITPENVDEVLTTRLG